MRIFTCRDCGHSMRLRGAECGACHMPKSIVQRLEFYLLGVLFLVIVAFLALLQAV